MNYLSQHSIKNDVVNVVLSLRTLQDDVTDKKLPDWPPTLYETAKTFPQNSPFNDLADSRKPAKMTSWT